MASVWNDQDRLADARNVGTDMTQQNESDIAHVHRRVAQLQQRLQGIADREAGPAAAGEAARGSVGPERHQLIAETHALLDRWELFLGA
jgi:hypothetical protein